MTDRSPLLGLSDHEWNMVLATKYLCLVGLVLLLQDHVASLGQERRLIWAAPRSLAKIAFLLNRYLVPPCLLVFVSMSSFAGLAFTNDGCWAVWVIEVSAIIVSLAIGNGVVTSHIIKLWDGRKVIKRIIWIGYTLAYAVPLACFVGSSPAQQPNVIWVPLGLNFCAPRAVSPYYIPAWGVPLVYELLLLLALVWNAIDRPRQARVSLVRALQRDGIVFMLVMTSLRVIQLSMVATLDPFNFFVLLFLIWSIVTMTLNRSILAMRQQETAQQRQFVRQPSSNTFHLDPILPFPTKASHRLSSLSTHDGASPIHIQRMRESFPDC